MRFLVRWLTRLVVLALFIGGALFYFAGRLPGPTIEIRQPARFVGLASPLEVSIEAPGGRIDRAAVILEQGDRRFELFRLDLPAAEATVTQESADRIRITRPVGRESVPELQPGNARLVVTAARPVIQGIRRIETSVSRDLELRFDPPRLAVMSTHHFVNHGGAEMVVYRVTPADAESGVRVGDALYPGFPAGGAGVPAADPALRVAFFALTYEQDLKTPIELYARDEAGNSGRAALDHRIFPARFRRSRIEVDDRFLERVVPEILERSRELGAAAGDAGDLLPAFLQVNGELRRLNAAKIAALAESTAPEILWRGPFLQMTNSQVESSFADQRTYYYRGQEIDQQVHLGFDLASTAAAPVHAANRGKVLFADYLGIYGNCVIVDHGMGLQSLYAHLSSLGVTLGQMVEKDEILGRTGRTGLAGGDHLHFTMLLQGQPVTPVEWWDPHWIEDRINRKLTGVSAPGP